MYLIFKILLIYFVGSSPNITQYQRIKDGLVYKYCMQWQFNYIVDKINKTKQRRFITFHLFHFIINAILKNKVSLPCTLLAMILYKVNRHWFWVKNKSYTPHPFNSPHPRLPHVKNRIARGLYERKYGTSEMT